MSQNYIYHMYLFYLVNWVYNENLKSNIYHINLNKHMNTTVKIHY